MKIQGLPSPGYCLRRAEGGGHFGVGRLPPRDGRPSPRASRAEPRAEGPRHTEPCEAPTGAAGGRRAGPRPRPPPPAAQPRVPVSAHPRMSALQPAASGEGAGSLSTSQKTSEPLFKTIKNCVESVALLGSAAVRHAVTAHAHCATSYSAPRRQFSPRSFEVGATTLEQHFPPYDSSAVFPPR